MPNKQVVLVGNVASGKTTVLQQLSLHPQFCIVPADELYLINPFFKLSKVDGNRWDFTNDVWFLLRRVQMMKDVCTDQENKKQTLIVDSGIWMSYLYGYVHAEVEHHMDTQEWQFFEECFDHLCHELPLPDLIVHLQAPFETLRQRIEKRGREFEVAKYFEYLHALDTGLIALKLKVKSLGIPFLELQTADKTPKKVMEEVMNAIR